jgi:putative transposase
MSARPDQKDGIAPADLLADIDLAALGLTLEGIELVRQSALSPPQRKVGKWRRRNMIYEVPMQSLPLVLQAESTSGEYFFLIDLDRRNDLVAVLDQPMTVAVEIVDSRGRATRTTYTPDYIVIDGKEVVAVEVKAENELRRLIEERKEDWIHDGTGYHYLPAECLFREYGIQHIVVSTSAYSPVHSDNLRLLSTTRDTLHLHRYRKIRKGVLSLLRNEGPMRIGDILDRIGDVDTTPILQLIDQRLAYVALDRVTLSAPHDIWIAHDANLVRIAQEADQTLRDIFRESDELPTEDVINPRYELDVAIRLAIANGESSVNKRNKVVSQRTARRYRKDLRDALGDVRALEPGWPRCGNHGIRISELHMAHIKVCIRAGRRNPDHPSIARCWKDYVRDFDATRIALELVDRRPISKSTFYSYWETLPLADEDARAKGGRRLENQACDAFEPQGKLLLATRAFSIAHIDHWKVDLFLYVGTVNRKRITARPWLTAMVDAYSGEVLAIWLSFAEPSKKACSMVIRDCVRRHGRLPELIITDGGPEFKSTHFLVMLATHHVVRGERPPEDPRFGKEVERIFGAFKERFARGLPGYGISIEQARAVSSGFRANNRASLTLLDAFSALETYVFNGYNQSPKPDQTSSRSALTERSLCMFPTSGRQVDWDLKFLIATSIEPPGSNYILWTGRGIHLNDKWYSSRKLLHYRGYKKDLTVRCEPFADSIIYVCIQGRWFVCANSDASQQFYMSDRQLIASSSERTELAALRRELKLEMDMTAALLVNEAVDRARNQTTATSTSPWTTQTTDQHSPEAASAHNYLPFNFENVEPLEESEEL